MTSDLAATMRGEEHDDRTAIWVRIPDGYVPLPLDDIARHLGEAQALVEERAPAATRPAVVPLVDALTVFLSDLAARNAVYCGLGRHASTVDGSTVTSSLVVALQEFPEQVNPRILLKDLVLTKAAAEKGQVDLVDVAGRPMLFQESDRELPTPSFPGTPPVPDGATSTVFQLEALVPSDDGAKLVSIEFSTPFVEHGPEFRAMVVELAASVSFIEPAPVDDAGDESDGPVHPSIADMLRG